MLSCVRLYASVVSLLLRFFAQHRYDNEFLALGLAAASESASLEGASSFLGDFAEVEDVVRLGVVLQMFVPVLSSTVALPLSLIAIL